MKRKVSKQTKESNSKPQSPEDFKKRQTSKIGSTVMEDLKKATNAEKEYRRGKEGRD